jgi:uncharacterized membrane protein
MNLLLANHHWGDGAGPLGWAVFALLLVALVVGVVAISSWLAGGRPGARYARPAPPDRAPADDALTVLRLRYARGEVSREEFLRASEDLGAPSPAGATSPEPPPQTPSA